MLWPFVSSSTMLCRCVSPGAFRRQQVESGAAGAFRFVAAVFRSDRQVTAKNRPEKTDAGRSASIQLNLL